MKEKHSGINKKVNNKFRALLALLVATAFLLPTGAILATPPDDDEQKKNREIVPYEFNKPYGYDVIWQPTISTDLEKSSDITITDMGTGQIIMDGLPDRDEGDLLFEQIIHDSTDSWSFGTSTDSYPGIGPYKIYDNFWGVTAPIGGFTFDALPLIWTGAGWSPGTADDLTFNIGFYSDGIGITSEPSAPVNEGQITPADYTTSVGQNYAGYPAYQWQCADGIGSTTLDEGWFSVQSASSPSNTCMLWGSAKTGDGYSYQAGGSPPQTAYDRAFALYEAGGGGNGGGGGIECGEYDWNAMVKGLYIEDVMWDPDTESYITVLKNIHLPHEQACMNEYLWWDDPDTPFVEPQPDWAKFDPDEPLCNMFTPGEHNLVAHIMNTGNHTYYNLPVHINIWKQVYEHVFVSGFEEHVFSDWVAIDGGGCVHPYPDGDTWTVTTDRACEGDYVMHVSKTSSYMKGANDTLRNRYPMDTTGGDCSVVSFWFWVEGDWGYEGGVTYSDAFKAYDFLQVYWIERLHDGTEIRHGPLDVEARTPIPGYNVCGGPWWDLDTEQVRTWWWSQQSDLWRGDYWGYDYWTPEELHSTPLCFNSGGPNMYRGLLPYNYNDPVWSCGRIEIDDEWKGDQTFIEFVWKADCMVQNEGAYIDDVYISRVFNQGEMVYAAHEQVNLVPCEAKALRFWPPWEVLEHGKYWIETRVKTHSNFVADENESDDWLKDEVRILCCHDVAITNVEAWPYKQQSGKVSSHLIPTQVSFDVTNCGPYNDEFDVTMDVFNMEYKDIFADDVEGGNRGWEHTGFGGPDLWHITTRDAESPTHSWACMESDAGFYDNDMSNYLISPTFDFSGYKDAYFCFVAIWSFGEGDRWGLAIYDPYSNFVIGLGSVYGNSGDWLPGWDGHPVWVGPGNPGDDGLSYFDTGYPQTGQVPFLYGMCMDITKVIEWLYLDGPDWLGIDMFGHQPEGPDVLDDNSCGTHPNYALSGCTYEAGIAFVVRSDGAGRESPENVEKWSGLFLDDIFIVGVQDGELVHQETFHMKMPGQGYTETITTEYCTDDIWGDFEIDIRTNLDIDCNPGNNWMDAYNHIYYIDWLDDVEDYTRYDEHPFEDGWTHVDLKQEGDSNWHIVSNIDPVEGNQYYWWCGDDDTQYYGINWNDCMISPEFDLYRLIPREPWCDPAVQLTFRMCAHLSLGDCLYVEISNDSGRNWYILDQWCGEWQSNCWNDYTLQIPDNFYTQGFMFRFRFQSDDSVYGWGDYTINKGILLDDITLEALKGKCITNEGMDTVDFEDGTIPGDWTIDTGSDPDSTWEIKATGGGTFEDPPNAGSYYIACDSDGNSGDVFDDEIFTPVMDLSTATSATLYFDANYQEYGSNPDNEFGEVRVYINGVLEDTLDMWNVDTGQFSGEYDLPLEDGVQVSFYYDTGGDTYEWWFAVDNVRIDAMVGEYGDPLAWYFEDDAETGGNPLWTLVPDYGGDIWHPYNYSIYHDPVYGTFGQIVSPILEYPPDFYRDGTPDEEDSIMREKEPWVFPGFEYSWIVECNNCDPGPVVDPQPHFWVCEKHHWTEYDDGINVWPAGSYTYLNNMDTILISPELDLQGTYHGHIWFEYIGALGAGDVFWVMVREKNDDGTWGPWNYMTAVNPAVPGNHIVEYASDPNWTRDNGWNLLDQVEQYYPWENPVAASPLFMVNLIDYVRKQATIQLGFRLISDEAGVGPGIKIDNIKLDVKRDSVAPDTLCSISGTLGCNDWYTSEVAVSLQATDNRVGVKETYYRIDGGAWQLYTGRFAVTADGAHTIEYYSVDNVGNEEEIKTCDSFKIDQTPPTVALSMPESGYLYIGGRPIFQIGRTIVIGDLTAQASASDATSGLDYVEFLIDGEVKSADLTAPFTFDLPKGGLIPASHTLQVKAYDNACNSATGTQTTYTKWL
jgi:hypothetical protein